MGLLNPAKRRTVEHRREAQAAAVAEAASTRQLLLEAGELWECTVVEIRDSIICDKFHGSAVAYS